MVNTPELQRKQEDGGMAGNETGNGRSCRQRQKGDSKSKVPYDYFNNDTHPQLYLLNKHNSPARERRPRGSPGGGYLKKILDEPG